jgi:hypothetical protein
VALCCYLDAVLIIPQAYSQTCVHLPPLRLKKVAIVQCRSLLRGCSLINIFFLLESWSSGWLLLTGGHCSEVIVRTGLAVSELI